MADILIVEDDPAFGEILMMHLEDLGHAVVWRQNLDAARRQLDQALPELILLDQQLPDGAGLDFLKQVKTLEPSLPVIMLTGVSDNGLVIEAMKAGAYDFVRKPIDELVFNSALNNALKHHRLSRKVAVLTGAEDYRVDVSQIVGISPAITDICKTIGSVAPSDASVLITGESGTGKEIVARAIHNHSDREGLFQAINCSAIVANLTESELFGHERGAFTGADRRKQGKFELASDGTLFLDELGDLPLPLQAKLLRVLQDGSFERVGGSQTLQTKARILAATNQDLESMIQQGSFRQDLYYRLNVIAIHLPPLRERMEDLPMLAEHLLHKINQRLHTTVVRLAEASWQRLLDYHWPGNVRELENLLTRALVLCHGDTLTPELLMTDDRPGQPPASSEAPADPPLQSLSELEAKHVQRVLDHTHWHKGKSCKILGISRPALDRKIEKHQLNDS